MSKIRAVIFDLYGTLVDILTNEGKDEIYKILALYLQYYGAKVTGDQLRGSLGLEMDRMKKSDKERYPEVDLEEVFSRVLHKEGLDHPFMVESCCKLFRLLSRERFQLFPETLTILRELKRGGYPLALLSDAQKVFSIEEMKMLGLDGFFDYVLMSTQFGFKKPDPRLFAMACALLGVKPEECVYVGDSPKRDVKGALETGMTVVLVRSTEDKLPREQQPHHKARDLKDFWMWLKEKG